MRRRAAILAVVPLLVGGATGAPTTAPAPLPVARWVDRLADPDPAVRDDARERLMGLPAAALPAVRDAVRAAGPVGAAQAAVLHDVVCHVFLAAEPYATRDTDFGGGGTRYIMGQNWPRWIRYGQARLGVPVVDRWPGFPARQVLRDGDLILGIYNNPDAPAGQPPDVLTPSERDLVYGQQECPSLPRMAMAVLRDGRPIRVTATLVAEPSQTAGRQQMPVAMFLADRQQRADDYWRAEFAPLVEAPMAAAGDTLDGTGR